MSFKESGDFSKSLLSRDGGGFPWKSARSHTLVTFKQRLWEVPVEKNRVGDLYVPFWVLTLYRELVATSKHRHNSWAPLHAMHCPRSYVGCSIKGTLLISEGVISPSFWVVLKAQLAFLVKSWGFPDTRIRIKHTLKIRQVPPWKHR